MNNPFDLKNYKPKVKYSDLEQSRRLSYQATAIVNKARKQGIEPSKPYAQRNMAHVAGLPQDYTTEMPKMPMHRRSVKRSKAKKEKNQ